MTTNELKYAILYRNFRLDMFAKTNTNHHVYSSIWDDIKLAREDNKETDDALLALLERNHDK